MSHETTNTDLPTARLWVRSALAVGLASGLVALAIAAYSPTIAIAFVGLGGAYALLGVIGHLSARPAESPALVPLAIEAE